MAAEMKVTEAVVELALLASYRIVCDHQGMPFSEDEFLHARNEQDAENRKVAAQMMRAALEAGLAAMLEPVGYLDVGLRQTDLLTARDFDGSEEKLTKWAATVGAPTAYRIKPK